jgi:hypothetical protein
MISMATAASAILIMILMTVQANHLEKAQSLYTDYLKKLDAVLAPPYQVHNTVMFSNVAEPQNFDATPVLGNKILRSRLMS